MCSDSMILHLPQKCLASSTLLYTCNRMGFAAHIFQSCSQLTYIHLIDSTHNLYILSIRTYPESFSLMSLLICRRHHSQSFSGAPLEAARPAVASIHAPRRRTRLPANGWHVGACLHWPRASKVEFPFNLQGPIDT